MDIMRARASTMGIVIQTPLIPQDTANRSSTGGIRMIPLRSEMMNDGLALALAEK